MTILRCYVDDRTMEILREVSRQTGREIEELAETAISEAACRAKQPPSAHDQLPLALKAAT